MFKNYLLISWRNLKRNRAFSLLNIGGLALGLAACTAIVLFLNHEYSFDRQHSNGKRIYRLNELQRLDGMEPQIVPLSMYPMGPAMQKDYPQIENFVRIDPQQQITVRAGKKLITVPQVLACDSGFFSVFDFQLLGGDRKMALSSPSSVVLTESTALKLFGSTSVIGQLVEVYQDDVFKPYNVSAVTAAIPGNSHLQFDVLIPMHGQVIEDWKGSWDANWLTTYLLLREGTDSKDLEAALPSFLKKYLRAEEVKQYDLFLQPLFDIHLGSEDITHDGLNHHKFSGSYVQLFLLIAIMVLLIAVLNFVNLSTARATKRAREVGIRKTIGARYGQLVRQFLSEAFLFSFLATVLGTLIVWLFLPLINRLVERNLELDMLSPGLWLILLGTSLVIGLLSGFYPALFISSYKPLKVMKGVLVTQGKQSWSLRNILVVTQFSIAVLLIIATLVILSQLNFIRNKDIGFNKEQVITIRMNNTANEKFTLLKQNLLANSTIAGITGYNQRLGNNIHQMGANYINAKGEKKHLSVSHLSVDYDYLNFFNIRLKKGRDFSIDRQDGKGRSYLINETLARQLETPDPIGTIYSAAWIRDTGRVIGVVSDFNFNSLHEKVGPLYISIMNWNFNEMAVKLKPGNLEAGISALQKEWEKLIPDMPFSYTFLDDHMASLYETDKRVNGVVTLLTILSLVIASLGLFGMAMFNTETRTKEIGIRKVLGATGFSIIRLLSGDFLKPVILSMFIAMPLAVFVMNKWLENFAYHISLQAWMFLLAGLGALLVSLLAVGGQTFRAAASNPVKSLRTE